jgi:hypothetical protein
MNPRRENSTSIDGATDYARQVPHFPPPETTPPAAHATLPPQTPNARLPYYPSHSASRSLPLGSSGTWGRPRSGRTDNRGESAHRQSTRRMLSSTSAYRAMRRLKWEIQMPVQNSTIARRIHAGASGPTKMAIENKSTQTSTLADPCADSVTVDKDFVTSHLHASTFAPPHYDTVRLARHRTQFHISPWSPQSSHTQPLPRGCPQVTQLMHVTINETYHPQSLCQPAAACWSCLARLVLRHPFSLSGHGNHKNHSVHTPSEAASEQPPYQSHPLYSSSLISPALALAVAAASALAL